MGEYGKFYINILGYTFIFTKIVTLWQNNLIMWYTETIMIIQNTTK